MSVARVPPGLERDVAVATVLTMLGAAVWAGLRSWLGAEGLALGSDPALWGLSAMNLRAGVAGPLPPLYPWLVAGFLALRGDLVEAGLEVSAVAWTALMPAMALLARRTGASAMGAMAAGISVFALPELLGFGLQVQPDAATALMLLGAGPVAAWFWRVPSGPRALGLGAWGSATWLLREHGAVLLVIYTALGLWAPGTTRQRGLRLALITLPVVCAPLLGLHAPGLPWAAPWMQRVAMAADASGGLSTMAQHARVNLARSWPAWTVIGLGLAALPGVAPRRRWMVLPVLTALPTLFIPSQPRHALVVAPAALLLLTGLLDPPAPDRPAQGSARRTLGLALMLGLAAMAPGLWRGSRIVYTQAARFATQERAFGQAVCAVSAQGLPLLGSLSPPHGWSVYCPLPIHALQPGQRQAADWRAVFVGSAAPGSGWTATGATLNYANDPAPQRIFVLYPGLLGFERPCAGSEPATHTPYLALEAHAATLVPPCDPAQWSRM